MVAITDSVFLDPQTFEIYDKKMGNSVVTKSDIEYIRKMVQDMEDRVPDCVITYDYLQWFSKKTIKKDFTLHVQRINNIIKSLS